VSNCFNIDTRRNQSNQPRHRLGDSQLAALLTRNAARGNSHRCGKPRLGPIEVFSYRFHFSCRHMYATYTKKSYASTKF
jgi:hypothetical protein